MYQQPGAYLPATLEWETRKKQSRSAREKETGMAKKKMTKKLKASKGLFHVKPLKMKKGDGGGGPISTPK
jgi:hypothetical protein